MIKELKNILKPLNARNLRNFYYAVIKYGSFQLLFCNHFTIKNKTGTQIQYLWRKKVNFPHPIGIVIGKGVLLGENVSLYQNVTLGGTKTGYPNIGNNVIIYPNCIIVGGIDIGDNAVIPPGSIVRGNVEAGCIYKSEG
ncbi:hypothetical protein [Vibrio sp. CK2-1]|uniref:hypothetical protein n=1 Tax=Vibrio sp. CK2-1 TaxID=2912249 RepID=UPI001F2B0BEB|nr:hypothetical protein [Vibrio sp. CK2-1]MCF7355391.1 hypothetical protein [Vibrio sp. CK2-1]